MDILDVVLKVFSGVGSWLVTMITSMIPIFYTAPTGETPGSLTFMGVLAVAGLAFSVVFLVMGIIQRFLHFRG